MLSKFLEIMCSRFFSQIADHLVENEIGYHEVEECSEYTSDKRRRNP